MTWRVRGVGASEVEWARWTRAAELAGLKRNKWVRRALSDRAGLEEALRRERDRVGPGDG